MNQHQSVRVALTEPAHPVQGLRVRWRTRPDIVAMVSHVQPLCGGGILVRLIYSHQDQRQHGVRPRYDVYWYECEVAS
jgi:hypothetical protein